jgi:hypothetical protein
VAVCAGAALLSWAFDAPTAGAVLLASSSPGILVTLYEILRVLDERADDATRRSCQRALLLLLIPIASLLALAARLGERAPWKALP